MLCSVVGRAYVVGNIIVDSIRICQQSRLWIHDDQLNDRIDCLAITFAYACKAQLRGNRINDEDEDGMDLVQKGILAQEELDVITNSASWQPYYCIDCLRATINEGLVRTEHDISYEGRKNAAHTAMEETIANLAGLSFSLPQVWLGRRGQSSTTLCLSCLFILLSR